MIQKTKTKKGKKRKCTIGANGQEKNRERKTKGEKEEGGVKTENNNEPPIQT